MTATRPRPPENSVGYEYEKDAILARLRRIEGQVRGLTRMVEDDTYCIDVLTQIGAATKGLQAVGLELLKDHLLNEGRLTEDQTVFILDEATQLMSREPNMLNLTGPITGACAVNLLGMFDD